MYIGYDDFKQSLLDQIEDSSEEVENFINTAINLAEDKVARDLDYQWLEVHSNMNTQPNDRVFKDLIVDSSGIPQNVEVVDGFSTTFSNARFLNFSYVYYQDGLGDKYKLKLVNESFLNEYIRTETKAGTPKYYALKDKNVSKIIIAPTPVYTGNANHKLYVSYRWIDTKLSPNNQTNLVFLKATTLLRIAALIEIYEFLHNDKWVAYYTQRYTNELVSHLNSARRERQDEGKVHNRKDIELQQSVKGGM